MTSTISSFETLNNINAERTSRTIEKTGEPDSDGMHDTNTDDSMLSSNKNSTTKLRNNNRRSNTYGNSSSGSF